MCGSLPSGAFWRYHIEDVTTIDGAYVGGISVTHSNQQQHIWTFAAGTSEGNYRMAQTAELLPAILDYMNNAKSSISMLVS